MKKLIGLILAVLIVLPLAACGGDKWPTSGLGAMLPAPGSGSIKISIDESDSFYATVEKPSSEEYKSYVSKCKERGFTIEADESSSSYNAFNEDGYKLELSNFSNSFSIEVQEPISLGTLKWPQSKIGSVIPKPTSQKGKIESESDDYIYLYVGDMSIDDFNDYIDQCLASGFDVEYERYDTGFSAKNDAKYEISVKYEGFNIVSIRVEKKDKDEDKKEETIISSEETKEPDVAEKQDIIEEDKNKKTDAPDQNTVRDDIKEAIDSYESFIDEYCEFMQTYDTSDMTMLSEYSDLVQKEIKMSKEFKEIENKDLTDAEAVYYSEVSLRCSQKLMEAASKMN